MTNNSESFVVAARGKVRAGVRVSTSMIAEVDRVIVGDPESARLWALRGDLIQLNEDRDGPPLEEARLSYERARALAPGSPEPLVELGHFHDGVLNDPAAAVPFFRAALLLGPNEAAEKGLMNALAQLGTGSDASERPAG